MDNDTSHLKFDQILDNLVFLDKEEITFDLGPAEILKKGVAYSSLKVKNLSQTRIALRVYYPFNKILVPKERFQVSPTYSYIEALETISYKFAYIYKEKANDTTGKNFCLIELFQIPKLKNENLNPISLFEYIVSNNIAIKGMDKKLPLRLYNPINSSENINSAFVFDKQLVYRKTSRAANVNQRIDNLNEDYDDPRLLSKLVKENMLFSKNCLAKEETERVFAIKCRRSSTFSKKLLFMSSSFVSSKSMNRP